MKISIGLRRAMSLVHLDCVPDKIFADLMAIGYNEVDAYNIAHPELEAVDDRYLLRELKAKQAEKKFSTYFEKQKARFKRIASASQKKQQEFEALSEGALSQVEKYKDKDFLIKALAVQAEVCTEPKKKADILIKIADLQNMKKEEVKEEKKFIHFYLPLTCNNCMLKELYTKALAEKRAALNKQQELQERIKRLENTGEEVIPDKTEQQDK